MASTDQAGAPQGVFNFAAAPYT
jgi:hypothetical protein